MNESNKQIGALLGDLALPEILPYLSNEDLKILCHEIRQVIITTTSERGGHVASSLGAVEIIVALHSLLNCPKDKIVFDVGHQAYAHKLLTGRYNQFSQLRTFEGIGGFPRPSESVYDVHPSGHASDSLSVAFGLAEARRMSKDNYRVVAVIGDAALSGGMAFEALNHIGQNKIPMLIILNDNDMSISPNVGALSRHLSRFRISSSYRTRRDCIEGRLENWGGISQSLLNAGNKAKNAFKHFIVPRTMIYENLGIICLPTVDGHDIAALREAIRSALLVNGPVLLHVKTVKGFGYPPAVENPECFHGVGPFDVATGGSRKQSDNKTYTSVFGETMVRLAAQDEDIVAITAAMTLGTGLSEFKQHYEKRFFDVGIAEEHALGLASGLAIGGKKPVVAIYSTFMQRSIDQMMVDNALMNNKVVFAIDRAGLVGEDGPTHHGVFDIVYTRMIPHMSVIAPSDEHELQAALSAAVDHDGCTAVRYPRGVVCNLEEYCPSLDSTFVWGKSRTIMEGTDVTLLGFGRLVKNACEAALILNKEGLSVRVVDMRFVKPLDEDAIERACETSLVVSLEEGVISGGIGQEIAAKFSQKTDAPPLLIRGIPDTFVSQGSISELFRELSLDAEGIAQSVKEAVLRAQESK